MKSIGCRGLPTPIRGLRFEYWSRWFDNSPLEETTMKLILVLAAAAAMLGGCAFGPAGYGDHRDGYYGDRGYRGDGNYRDYGYRDDRRSQVNPFRERGD
jgi:hypothetical protein